MVSIQQSWRFDDIRPIDGIHHFGDGDASSDHLCGFYGDVKLRLASALDQHRRNPAQTIQPGLDLVRRELPEIRLRNLVGRQAVADDRESGKIQSTGSYLNRRRQAALDTGYRGVDILERFDHIHAPIEEEIDRRRTSACHGANLTQTGDSVDRLLNGPSYRDF